MFNDGDRVVFSFCASLAVHLHDGGGGEGRRCIGDVSRSSSEMMVSVWAAGTVALWLEEDNMFSRLGSKLNVLGGGEIELLII